MPDVAFDLRNLKYALAVAEHGSFRRAAAALDVSQSTISRRIQLLERRLGVALFERSRSGVRPTIAGERFIRESAAGAEQLRHAIAEATAAVRGDGGAIRIGVMTSLSTGHLADALERFHRRFPDIDVRLEEAGGEANIAGVVNGRLDVAFVVGISEPSECRVVRLPDQQIYVVMAEEHPLADNVSLRWEALRDEKFLVTAEGYGQEVEGILTRSISTFGFHPIMSVQHVGRENLMNMVSMGFGVTLASASTMGVAYRGLKFVPILDTNDKLQLSAVWSIRTENPALKKLMEHIQRVAL